LVSTLQRHLLKLRLWTAYREAGRARRHQELFAESEIVLEIGARLIEHVARIRIQLPTNRTDVDF
jgi:hypothetical protein